MIVFPLLFVLFIHSLDSTGDFPRMPTHKRIVLVLWCEKKYPETGKNAVMSCEEGKKETSCRAKREVCRT